MKYKESTVLLIISILVQVTVYFICDKIGMQEYGKGFCVGYSGVFIILVYILNKD